MHTEFDTGTEAHPLRDKLLGNNGADFRSLLRSSDRRVKLGLGADEDQIQELRDFVGGTLPDKLGEFLRHSNGVKFYNDDVLYSAAEIIRETERMHSMKEGHSYPVDHLLFIGSAGDGDLFAFGRCASGLWSPKIYWWDHEMDSCHVCAVGIYGYVAAHVAWWACKA